MQLQRLTDRVFQTFHAGGDQNSVQRMLLGILRRHHITYDQGDALLNQFIYRFFQRISLRDRINRHFILQHAAQERRHTGNVGIGDQGIAAGVVFRQL